MKKTPSKVAYFSLIQDFFFLLAWAAYTAQPEEFMFQNVAYRPTVHETGVETINWFTKLCSSSIVIWLWKWFVHISNRFFFNKRNKTSLNYPLCSDKWQTNFWPRTRLKKWSESRSRCPFTVQNLSKKSKFNMPLAKRWISHKFTNWKIPMGWGQAKGRLQSENFQGRYQFWQW